MPTPVSPHFTLEELVHSDVALRRGIDNTTADPAVINRLTAITVNVLEPIRAHYGLAFSPISGYRCPALNQLIGGVADSQHMRGEAVDITLPSVTRFDLAQWIYQSLTFDQLILELYTPGDPDSGWVHCSYVSTAANRRQVLTYPSSTRRYVIGLQR